MSWCAVKQSVKTVCYFISTTSSLLHRADYTKLRKIILKEEKETLSAMVPDVDYIDQEGPTYEDTRYTCWRATKKVRAILVMSRAHNATDQQEILEKTLKVKFGLGWKSVWEKCGGYTARINR